PRAKTIYPPAPYKVMISCARLDTWVQDHTHASNCFKLQPNVFHALSVLQPDH
ncbi:hypothetical protein BDU57DRAFT_421392, partial [Ampelomyces quisqualis]